MSAIKDHLYLRIAHGIEQQIRSNLLCTGDRLPSLRKICQDHNVSQSTAMKAYYHLESRSLIGSRPQSGYYVLQPPGKASLLPTVSSPGQHGDNDVTEKLIDRVYGDMNRTEGPWFSMGIPAPEMLPVAKLTKGMIQAMRRLPAGGTSYEAVQGSQQLRRQIARWSRNMDATFTGDDIVTTNGSINSISLALMAITNAGDTIIVESPVYFGILQLAKSLHLKVIELPTDPETGIDLDAVKRAFQEQPIKAALLVANFNNPLGSCMPDGHKMEMVRLCEHYGIPLIDDDLYGDLHFSPARPRSCKTYDESGLVLWCGSVSKTLAPGYRVGWIAPGKFKTRVNKLKLYHTISSNTLSQEVIADFLGTGRYEHHLRKMRQTLYANSLRYSRIIAEHFPEGTRVSRPQGGFMLWLELPKQIDTLLLYETALRHHISFAPGQMFTLQKQFSNCMRLSYGLTWKADVESGLKVLGALACGQRP